TRVNPRRASPAVARMTQVRGGAAPAPRLRWAKERWHPACQIPSMEDPALWSIRAVAVPVITSGALERLDLQEEPLDRRHPHRRPRLDRCGPVRAGPPRGVAHHDDAVRRHCADG